MKDDKNLEEIMKKEEKGLCPLRYICYYETYLCRYGLRDFYECEYYKIKVKEAKIGKVIRF